MSLALLGLSHHTSPVELRERLALPPDLLAAFYRNRSERLPGCAMVALSTCNRVELYLHDPKGASPETLHERAAALLVDWHGLEPGMLEGHFYQHAGSKVVEHLFRVASSLDSMVVGESEILGQVQDAFLAAQTQGATDKVLNALFQRAFKVAKDIRTNTTIGQGRVSVPSVAVELAVSIFQDLGNKTVLVVGSGAMGEQTLRTLLSHGVGDVIVANRSVDKAERLAGQFGGEALAFDALPCHLARADIVLTTTGADEPILYAGDFQRALKARQLAPVLVVDIAVPRDVHADVNTLDNVYLYDIDDLKAMADQNLAARRTELTTCGEMVEDHTERFMRWLQGLEAEPTIVAMNRELEAIRAREVEKSLKVLGELTPEQQREIDYLSRRLTKAFLQRPMTQLKAEAARADARPMLHLVKRLFGIEESM